MPTSFLQLLNLLSAQYLQYTFQLLHLFIYSTYNTNWIPPQNRQNNKQFKGLGKKQVLCRTFWEALGFVAVGVFLVGFFLWVFALLSSYMPFLLPQDNYSNPFPLPWDNSLCKIGQYAGVIASHKWRPTSPRVHWWASRLLSKRLHHCWVCLFLPQWQH